MILPCELPVQTRAAELPAQGDLSTPLSAEDWARLETQDAAAYNGLYPAFNANLDWAAQHCVAKPGEKPKP